MKKKYSRTLILIILMLLPFLIVAQIINIPDSNLKHFLTTENCVDSNGDGIFDSSVDTNNDGEVQVNEAEAISSLSIYSTTAGSYDNTAGLESFINLETLKFSGCIFSNFNIDFNNLALLKHLYINGLPPTDSINGNQLTNLETLSITSLFLYGSSNQLNIIDIGNLVNLKTFNYSGNFLAYPSNFPQNFDQLSQLSNLEHLQISNIYSSIGVNYSVNLDLENLNNLKYINFNNAFVYVSNANYLPNLEEIYHTGDIGSPGTVGNPSTATFSSGNSYNFNNSPNLRIIDCKKQDISGFNNLQNLEFLSLDNTEIEDLGIINSPNLIHLSVNYLNDNGYPWDTTFYEGSIIVSNLTNLEYLSCKSNNLTDLSINNLSNLMYLDCSGNDLSYLDFNNMQDFNFIYCTENNFTNLDVSHYENLIDFNCANNANLTSLSIKNNSSYPISFYDSLDDDSYDSDNTSVFQINLSSNHNLEYICVDDANIQLFEDEILEQGYENINVDASCTSLNDEKYDSFKLNMYPNPPSSILIIEAQLNVDKAVIYDISGRVIDNISVNNMITKIPVQNLNSGQYFIKIFSGEKIVVKKFIKK